MIKNWMAMRRARREGRKVVVLSHLVEGEELTGMQLHERTGMRFSQLYTALEELEQGGKIMSRWIEGPYPRRRVYRVPGCWCCGRNVRPLDEQGACGFCGVNRSDRSHAGDQPCKIGVAS